MPKDSYRSILVVHRNDTTSVYVEGLPVAEIVGANQIKIVSAKKPDQKMCDDLAVAMATLTMTLLSIEPLVEQQTKTTV